MSKKESEKLTAKKEKPNKDSIPEEAHEETSVSEDTNTPNEISTPNNETVQEIANPVQEVANRIPVNPQLQKFRTADGPFGWFAHGVTGEEMNQFVSSFQKHLIESHDNNIELRSICEQLVHDLGQFDEKYLQQTVLSMKASEQACQQAEEARQRIGTVSGEIKNKLDQTQTKLDEVIESNSRLIKKNKSLYWIAGISGVVALIAVILHFIPVK